jgi:hypothetical protein
LGFGRGFRGFKNGFGVFMVLGFGIGVGSGRSLNVPPILNWDSAC